LNTHGLLHDPDPRDWPRHRFGLPAGRWARLRGCSYWVTGAGTGFGQAIAVALTCAGAQVFLTGRRPEKLAETVEAVRRLGGPVEACHPVPADVTDEEQVARACRFIHDRCPSLHGLVNNAAVSQRQQFPWPLQQETPAYWRQLLAVNVTAPLLVTAAALPHMVRGGTLRVLFVTSEAGWAFTPGFGHYNVSKAALNSLGASFAEECAARYPNLDVQINVLVPGEAHTEMNRGSERSPYTIAGMVLLLLSHPPGGPNARFFHADGRHLPCGYAPPYDRSLLHDSAASARDAAYLIEEGYRGFNIICCGGRWYGLGQEEGAFEQQKLEQGQYLRCIQGESLEVVRAKIRYQQRLLRRAMRFAKRCVGFPRL
jgi:NAD(P)-dependent dehydrogenase (short-subunit alcohol dehydrogenase family)